MIMPHPPFIMLDEASGQPIYRQIYETIRESILSGKFFPTMPLPASRLLAKQLRVSRMTVVNAYDQLTAEGYLESRPGAGTFVAEHLPEEFLQASNKNGREAEINLPRRMKFSAFGNHLNNNSRTILPFFGESSLSPFQQGVPAIDKFPSEVWSRIAQKWQKKIPPGLLGYQDSGGYAPLREAIAAHLVSTRGLRCTAEQVIVTGGTQQSLDLIGRVFLEKGSEVFIEDPCYAGARTAFEATGARLVPVPLDDGGFDLQKARGKSNKARLVYVTPSFQYPLGITMSLARRMNLLEWASETDSFIIEDDYNSEFRYASRPIAALQGLDSRGRVIYLGTFSKTVFPALRLGCIVVPTDLIEVFTTARALTDLHSPSIEQAILAEFISERHLTRHIRRMRGIYEQRQQILVTEAKKHLKGWLEVAASEAGMHLVGWLPEGVDDRAVAADAAEANLKIMPLSLLCIKEKMRGGLVLGYAAFDEQQIKAGVKKLAQVLKKFD